MSTHTRKHWLLAYDIRNPKRLQRIHAYLLKRGWPLQYSVFGLELSDQHLCDLLDDLVQLMDVQQDDIRAYHLPRRCQVWTLGHRSHPEGIEINASTLLKLMARSPSASLTTKQPATTRATREIQTVFSTERAKPKPRKRGD